MDPLDRLIEVAAVLGLQARAAFAAQALANARSEERNKRAGGLGPSQFDRLLGAPLEQPQPIPDPRRWK